MLSHTPVAKPSALYSSWNFLPYSPDLAPSDIFLITFAEKFLKGNYYETDAEVEADVHSWCRSQTPEFFADGMRKLVQRWRLCIERDDEYVEK